MTLDEMDNNLAEEAKVRAERIAKWKNTRNATHSLPIEVENPDSAIAKSFYCQNHHHYDCKWDACKCVCHDSSEWAMGRSC